MEHALLTSPLLTLLKKNNVDDALRTLINRIVILTKRIEILNARFKQR